MKNRAFTLIELLVVVLIIGILAAIALPQYEKAVAKSRVATVLPLMRRWHDALSLYKLEHGSYVKEEDSLPSADDLGVSWPQNWECSSNGLNCFYDLWSCYANGNEEGEVICQSNWQADDDRIIIMQTQPDQSFYPAGTRFCMSYRFFSGDTDTSACKFLGGKQSTLEGADSTGTLYEF